jgi:hypothetical protein
MAKNLTLDEKIAAANAAIIKEEDGIKFRRERLAKLRRDLAKFEDEKARAFSDELIAIIGDCGISSDEGKRELIQIVKSAADSMTAKNEFSSSVGNFAIKTNSVKVTDIQ